MEQNLIIIKFFFKKNGINNTDKSLVDFFENGISFPLLVKLIFGDLINDIIQDPKSERERQQNNNNCLHFLNDKLESHFTFSNEAGRNKLLDSILDLSNLEINDKELLEKCNIILKPLNIKYEKVNDLIDIRCLVFLLNVLTDGLISKDLTKYYDSLLIFAFEQAKVPLIINDQSFRDSKKFYIQIAIIFDVFCEKVEKIISMNFEIKQDNAYIEYHNEESMEIAIFNTINAIGKKKNLVLNLLLDASSHNFIPKFVMLFFNLEFIENVFIDDGTNDENNNKQNIMATIEFLKKKDEIFDVLSFNFDKFDVLSFFHVFLNTFFIKDSKKKMDERTKALLCTKKFKYYDYKSFMYLIHFVSTGNLHIDYESKKITDEFARSQFESSGIPRVINKNMLITDDTSSVSQNSDIIYYQLKFIFDALDSSPKSHKIVENFLTAILNFQKIKIPRYEILISSIKAKQDSIKLQHLNFQKIKTKSIDDSKNEENFHKVIKIPKSFKERHRIKFFDDEEKNENLLNDDSKYFWNSTDFHYNYDNGILYEHKTNKNEWIKLTELNSKSSNKKSLINDNQKMAQYLSFKRSSNNFEAKIFKIFYYDEIKEKWKFDSSAFDQFSKEKRINIGNSRTPIVLLLESYNDDLRSINSNIINGLFPSLSDDQIFVYAFCDRSLSMLNYKIDFSNKEKSSIKPIFLTVHVPKGKSQLPKIDAILIQIYCFLSLISDLEIVVLNQNYFIEQIKFIEIICSIINQGVHKSQKNPGNKLQIHSPLLICHKSQYDIKEKPLIVKNSKIIFLVNDEKVEYDQSSLENEYLKKLITKIKKDIKFHLINVNNLDSYESFLDSLNDILLESSTIYAEVAYNFTVYIPKFCSVFIELKQTNESYLKNELEKLILRRYSILTEFDNLKTIYLIWNEVYIMFPTYDTYILDICNSILSKLKEKVFHNSRDFCISEIKESSELNLLYINELLNSNFYWTMEQLNLIKENHFQFLTEEYFDIVHARFYDDDFDVFFENNHDIVDDLIKEDNQKINDIFKEFIKKIDAKMKEKEKDANEEILKGVNYVMKESENLREIKVTVEIGGDLKSEIEQDF